MKLLSKLTFQYMFFSLAAMLVSGVVIYFALEHIINYQQDERLNENLKQVETRLKNEPETAFYDPLIDVHPVENHALSIVLSDTLVYNNPEKELEEYRKLTAIISTGDKFYHVEILKSKIESEDLLILLILVTFSVIGLLTGLLIYANRRISKAVWKPFFSNLQSMEEFSVISQQPLQLGKTGISEFDLLNETVSRLTEKIISDFRSQKQFSEDVSHELQTPLAIISSRLESLLEKPELKDHAEVLNSIYTSVRRLSKLNKALILLSKIENNQFATSEKSNLKLVITEKLDEFSELIALKKLTTEIKINADFMVSIPPALAEILVNNLLSNCINHNIAGGKIRIETLAGQLTVSNSGTTEILNAERLFNRFYKENPSSNSVGLGLAIVKKICDNHSISIDYSFENDLHRFTFTFPL